ncbi:GPO family capsid scaffolding protein [Vibrio nigripulchritudo]|uniref:GPO family capsid scaffolding protein n=1 Tax=Vibrio nigripulchritudo TaxID=28173 RepID=UPI002491D609|nr:GPO family capsid scaffolding protein [Vibrio nigripulchritudo]BDU38746.1 phage capsid scaffolding protein [Vibrio nigripulchritudo]BDU44466.1 phage capsid scaffolding protein [Vibrio nigripulchritudo]
MFQSQPICILQAGTTVDGRVVEQNIIDEIAETYSTEVYTARINEEHYDWSYKFGSVLSVEKRDDKLFAVLKPNSMLLRAVEQGQLLHTSCEYIEKFSDTEKAYLTGLALTDKPASLGTTQIHLSSKEEGKVIVSSNLTIQPEQFSLDGPDDETSLFTKFKSWLKGEPPEQLSQQQEEDMATKTEELLEKSIEQNQELNSNLGKLITQLSSQHTTEGEGTSEGDESGDNNQEVTELKGQVETLSSQVGELSTQIEKLSKLTDEDERKLAGEDAEEAPYL